jgi:hypothetical protein
MAQSFCQRDRLLSTGQWSYILKKTLKGCKTPINETYLDQNRTAMRILWTEVLEGKGRHSEKRASHLSKNVIYCVVANIENVSQVCRTPAQKFSCGTSARIKR